MGHVRWVPETGHVWFATEGGGFWVVELAPQVRDHLGLDAADRGKARRPSWAGPPDGSQVHRPRGHPGTAGVQRVAVSGVRADLRPAWCTLGGTA